MTFREFVLDLLSLFNTVVVPLLAALTLFVFLWGMFNYFFIKYQDPNARKEGAQFMLWGIIGLAVIVLMWGLVALVTSIFGT